MGTFKKGILLGGLLGGGLVWLNTTKKGRELRDQVIDYAAEIYADIKKRVMDSETWDTLTESKYMKMVEAAVASYSTEKGLAENVRAMITKVLSGQWKTMRKQLQKEKKK